MKLDRRALARQLVAQAPVTRPLAGLRPAAVLVPLFRRDDQEWLLLTRRTDDLEHHSGEISFPGGGRHPEDADLQMTALRETEEEMGIRADDVEVFGRLDDFLSIHGYRVTPFVGSYPQPYPYRVNPGEIAEVIELPLRKFLQPGVWHQETWPHRGEQFRVDFYQVDGHQVWGLTAAILRQFLERAGLLSEG